MASDNEKLLCHVASLACATHASKVAHLAVEHKSGTLVFLCGFRMDRKKKRKKAGTAAVGGGNRAALAPHRQITLERTHHLCLFVELSHFNPPAGPIWELTYTSPMA